MNYCCEECRFVFSRKGEVTNCPSCDGQRIRPATEDETERLLELLKTEST